MADVNALLLSDGRFPSGGHAHSGGLEEAVADGRVGDLDTLAGFLSGRLATVGLAAAALAAAACGGRHPWRLLDAEAEARIASPALRATSRRQGRQLMRTALAVWGGEALNALDALAPGGPHHPVALGAVSAAAGMSAGQAAAGAAYGSVVGPATAAVRLLSLDPIAVHALIGRLAPEIDRVSGEGLRGAGGPLHSLPCPAAPMLDIAAQCHAGRQARLFAS